MDRLIEPKTIELYEAFRELERVHAIGPSRRELMGSLGWSSHATFQKHLKRLMACGLIVEIEAQNQKRFRSAQLHRQLMEAGIIG